jgi:GNAT superfamily N-acetyltransferase
MTTMHDTTFRQAAAADAAAIHHLIVENLEAGHLLPRTFEDVETHAPRFLVAEAAGRVVACAELAPLSPAVAEVRSLVVDEGSRGRQIGPTLVAELAHRANRPRVRDAQRVHPRPVALRAPRVHHRAAHVGAREDRARLHACPLFRRCGQYAVTLALRPGVQVRPIPPAAIIHGGRAAAARRPTVERLQLQRPAPGAGCRRDEPAHLPWRRS